MHEDIQWAHTHYVLIAKQPIQLGEGLHEQFLLMDLHLGKLNPAVEFLNSCSDLKAHQYEGLIKKSKLRGRNR